MEFVAGTSGTDLVSEAIAELYAGDPDAFVQRRRELAAQARAAGDRDAAKAIGALAKPTRSAWIVNRLVHADSSVADSLGELGDRLRSGEAALDGASIRELSRQRRELVDTLVRRALSEAGQDSPSVALRDEVTDTFNAALADAEVAEQVAAGTLQKAVHWAGFGPGIGSAVSSGPARSAAAPARTAAAPARAPSRTAEKAKGRTAPKAAARRPESADESAELEDTQRQEAERQEAEREEQERRQIVGRAEETAAEAERAADAAAATEREISESVTFMQERLSREQQRLVQARRDTRQAAAAATRAKQALDRIRRQFG
jgi:hypothetical protein